MSYFWNITSHILRYFDGRSPVIVAGEQAEVGDVDHAAAVKISHSIISLVRRSPIVGTGQYAEIRNIDSDVVIGIAFQKSAQRNAGGGKIYCNISPDIDQGMRAEG